MVFSQSTKDFSQGFGDADCAVGAQHGELGIRSGQPCGGFSQVRRQSFGKVVAVMEQGIPCFMLGIQHIVGIGIPKGAGTHMAVGTHKQCALRGGQGIETDKVELVNFTAVHPSPQRRFWRAVGGRAGALKYPSGGAPPLGVEAFVVATVQPRQLLPKFQAPLHEFGRLLEAPLLKGFNFTHFPVDGLRIDPMPIHFAKVPQDRWGPA